MNIERKARIEIALAETAKALKKLRHHSRISLTDATFAPDRAAPVSPCWAQRLSALEEFFSADFIPEFGASETGTSRDAYECLTAESLACSEPRRSLNKTAGEHTSTGRLGYTPGTLNQTVKHPTPSLIEVQGS